LIVTAETPRWVQIAAHTFCGYATSVIGCDAEVGVDSLLDPTQTPDQRPGAVILAFAFSRDALQKAVVNRVGQCLMTCPTTACYNGLTIDEKAIAVGGKLRYFGDGWQKSKRLSGRCFWRIPVMDGEFTCEDLCGTTKGVAGGNVIIMGRDRTATLAAAEAGVAAIATVPDAITPFPGGIARSGSKVGSKYKALRASTNTTYAPTLRGLVATLLPDGADCAYEIVIDGLTLEAVERATAAALAAACGTGVHAITSGNYGGTLGKFHIRLHDVWNRFGRS
jgi:formylmethanofuran--tetrahydromethanopterin N-formyltransferase